MTRALIVSGTHPRHLYVHRGILSLFDDLLIVVMEREDIIPITPNGLNSIDSRNYVRHYRERAMVEQSAYGDLSASETFADCRCLHVSPEHINSQTVYAAVKAFDADLAFVFGCNMIQDPVLRILPPTSINLHLGLSPWYRGSATLFWPFYFMEPQFAGYTFHRLSEKPDAGEIIHQSCPDLVADDGIHDVGARCVTDAAIDAQILIRRLCDGVELTGQVQHTTGRVWRRSDFRPAHLRVIYSLFENDIVAHYLADNLGNHRPMIHNGLESLS